MATTAPCGAPEQCPLVVLLLTQVALTYGRGPWAENLARLSVGMDPVVEP